ncbi:type II secretion system F family protein [Schaalia odontolytica]|uniref:Flp pilus assembly protein TadB n=1 Tax=Schaalia odontolytica TaxID=1660 RepID=A0A2X0VN62_9ACTO|nr:type II secretion system F family protein [Schaalia odontolytica]WMS26579.1 type II secretion system F family protein [Schaalia odontolytica]SPT55362.1 Flp pilus assembly protein TadB [Schaalia odontolytica]
MRWGVGWLDYSDGGNGAIGQITGRAAVYALSLCALILAFRALAVIVRGLRERRIVRAWMHQPGSSDLAADAWRRRLRRLAGQDNGARHRGRSATVPTTRELSLLIAEVATRLRSGAPTAQAWSASLVRIGVGCVQRDSDDYPPILDEWACEPPRRSIQMRARSPDAAASRSAAASISLACRFSNGLGAPLADILDAIGDSVDDAQAVEEARRVASAGPLMSGRVLAALPLVGIVSALALGASPWHFYTGSTVGRACALVGILAWAAGIVSSRRILARARRSGSDADAALACDLASAGLACGAAIPRVLDALASASTCEALSWTARALRLGAAWDEAWEETPVWTHPLRDALESSWTSGSAPETMLARSASWERRTRLTEAKTRAEELGVRLVGPLGVCFLPAFLALGIVPLLASLSGGIDM